VLQRDRPLPVWGTAEPGEKVAVSLGAQKGSGVADKDGRWTVILPAQPLSKAPLVLSVSGKNHLTRQDILLGDVWLCSGQSNMDFPLGACDVPQDIAASENPQIRHFRVGYNFASVKATALEGAWAVAGPATAGGFSAVGYYFGRKLQAQTGVPIGLLTSSVGGTNIELWISQEALLGTPALEPYAKQMRDSLDIYQQQLRAALPALRGWADAAAKVPAAQKLPLPPAWPEFPFSERVNRPRCVTLHNGMIAPLVPFSFRGAIWYQGESNADDVLYVEKKRAMVDEWRRLFQNPQMPFYFVQLAAWLAPDDNPAGGGWGMIRDLQRQCLTIPHTGMASALDVGDAEDIHPKNKADVGERLALWALRNEYGIKDLTVSGPLLRDMAIEGSRIQLRFESLGGGLMVGKKDGRKPAVEDPGATLKRFAIAGADQKWAWADAVISGDTVILSSPAVPSPVAARYAYSGNPAGANLYNRAGLPASPFRTDKW
jgi:sialate O-acetylesterase